MNQTKLLLRIERKAMIAWAAGSGAFILLIGLIFVSMGGEDGFAELWETYPDNIKEALGIQEISSVDAFIKAEIGLIYPIMFGILLALFMTKHLVGAEESGRIDHDLARPISRTQYYWQTLSAATVFYLVILAAVGIGGVLAVLNSGTALDMLGMFGLALDFLPIGLAMIGVGALAGAVFHTRALASGSSAAVVALFFAFDFTGRLVEGAEATRYLSLTWWAARSDLYHGAPDWGYLLVSLGLAATTAIAGWKIFDHKDLHG